MSKVIPEAGKPEEYGRLVEGYWYRAIIAGAPFDFWVPRKLARREAREAALEFAGVEFYDEEDIDSVRQLRGWGCQS